MSEEFPERSSLATLIPYMKPYRLRLILVCILVIAVVLIDLIQPWLVKEIIDRYVTVSHPDSGAILKISATYLVLVICVVSKLPCHSLLTSQRLHYLKRF